MRTSRRLPPETGGGVPFLAGTKRGLQSDRAAIVRVEGQSKLGVSTIRVKPFGGVVGRRTVIPLGKLFAGVYKIFLELVPFCRVFDVPSPFGTTLWKFQPARWPGTLSDWENEGFAIKFRPQNSARLELSTVEPVARP